MIDFEDSLYKILQKAKNETMVARETYGNFYQKHYCQMIEIKGKQHYQIFTDYDKSMIGNTSRFCHGKPISSMNRSEPVMPLSFVCQNPDGELLTRQTRKRADSIFENAIKAGA